MVSGNNASSRNPAVHKLWVFIRKNGFSVVMALFAVVVLVSPDAKSFVLRQLMRTGLFNASIGEKKQGATGHGAVDFNFVDGNEDVRHTSSLRGKVIFINFWASWCPPCRAEFPSIERLYSAFKDHPDIFFLMINEDNDLSAGYDYLRKNAYSVPVYRVSGPVPPEIYTGILPTTVVLDKDGEIRLRHEGFADYGSQKFMEELERLMGE